MSDRDDFLAFCRAQIGKPYVLGALGPDQFDCSGLILSGLKTITDQAIPRLSTDQSTLGSVISAGEVLPGDLLFFDTGWSPRNPDHVGVATGDSMMIDANSVSGVTEEAWNTGYWGKCFTGARRIFDREGTLRLTAVPAAEHFRDLPSSHPQAAEILTLVQQGVVGGYDDGTFRPDRPVRRDEAVKVVLRAFEIPLITAKSAPFTDVGLSDWFADFAATAKKHRLVSGTAESSFLPHAEVNRAELAKLIFRAAGEVPQPPKLSPLTDVPADAWYAPFALAAQERKMFSVTGSRFLPAQSVSRGELCLAIVRFASED